MIIEVNLKGMALFQVVFDFESRFHLLLWNWHPMNKTILLPLSLLAACGADDALPDNAQAALATYADIAHASYEDSWVSSQALDAAVLALVSAPTGETLAGAKAAWLAAREPYLQTEVFRFYGGPIDDPDTGPEGLINAWPLDEAYIDYVIGNASAGVINRPNASLDQASLLSLNEQGGEKNIATGFHAIEFLLWGQDTDPNGPGSRPHTDYVDGPTATLNQARRALYLSNTSTLLRGHLESLTAAWAPGLPENYRTEWDVLPPREGLRRALTGMIILSGFETGGERLQTALDSGDQEDEHSCFSDNTHRDMVQDIQGVLNVWRGTYTQVAGTTISGTGLADVVRIGNPELADSLDAQLANSLAAANALVPPFDQEIALANTPGRARVQALVAALRRQERLLEEVFREFELSIPAPE